MATPQPYEKVSKLSRKELIENNFLGGLAWALGATVGLSIILALLGILTKGMNLVPFVGSFVSQIITFILTNNPNLHK